MKKLAIYMILLGFFGESALAQNGISTLMMNVERPLINEEVAKKIARIVVDSYYDRKDFIPSNQSSVVEYTDRWNVTFINKKRSSDLYKMGFRSITLAISKKNGCISLVGP